MEKVLEQDMEKYLLMLVELGAKLSKDFDINRLKETPRTNETEPNHTQDTNQVVALTAQMQILQQ